MPRAPMPELARQRLTTTDQRGQTTCACPPTGVLLRQLVGASQNARNFSRHGTERAAASLWQAGSPETRPYAEDSSPPSDQERLFLACSIPVGVEGALSKGPGSIGSLSG
jgi:hypothetical protein